MKEFIKLNDVGAVALYFLLLLLIGIKIGFDWLLIKTGIRDELSYIDGRSHLD